MKVYALATPCVLPRPRRCASGDHHGQRKRWFFLRSMPSGHWASTESPNAGGGSGRLDGKLLEILSGAVLAATDVWAYLRIKQLQELLCHIPVHSRAHASEITFLATLSRALMKSIIRFALLPPSGRSTAPSSMVRVGVPDRRSLVSSVRDPEVR